MVELLKSRLGSVSYVDIVATRRLTFEQEESWKESGGVIEGVIGGVIDGSFLACLREMHQRFTF